MATPNFKLHGVMQAPVTPMKDDFSFDGDGFAKMVDFHVRHGAPAIAWPHHKAESLNLTIAERKLGAEIAVKTVNKRVPVFAGPGLVFVQGDVLVGCRSELAVANRSCAARDAEVLEVSHCWVRGEGGIGCRL